MEKRSGATVIVIAIIFMFLISNKKYDGVVIENLAKSERNISADGYNIGKRGECVEFIKRYYYEKYGHKMPNSYGHASDFFINTLPDGKINTERGLVQYNPESIDLIEEGDILVFKPTKNNIYGHVSIVRSIFGNYIVTTQQNSFSYIGLTTKNNKRIKGFLKKPLK